MSRIEVLGRFCRRDCQLLPSSKDTYTVVSVPAKSKPFCFGSSRITFTQLPVGWSLGNPLTILVHVLPPSCVRHINGILGPGNSGPRAVGGPLPCALPEI